jgi:kynurenine formamidase
VGGLRPAPGTARPSSTLPGSLASRVREIPGYAELLQRTDAPAGSAWGVFGPDDQLGTLNFIGPDEIAAAATTITKGRVFPLNLDLSLPNPGFFDRSPPTQTMVPSNNGAILDDYLDGFYPQGSSHWDGLRHCAHREHGFYNATSVTAASRPGGAALGIQHWAKRGIVGRGVLIDIPRALQHDAITVDPLAYFEVTATVLAQALDIQRTELRAGDVLLLRTGWLAAYRELDSRQRTGLASAEPPHPGLYGREIPAFLWDHRIAAIAADNPALEAARPIHGVSLELHEQLIALLGMPLGELWDLEDIASDCAQDGRYTFFLTSSPLAVVGGAGSPANALAIK